MQVFYSINCIITIREHEEFNTNLYIQVQFSACVILHLLFHKIQFILIENVECPLQQGPKYTGTDLKIQKCNTSPVHAYKYMHMHCTECSSIVVLNYPKTEKTHVHVSICMNKQQIYHKNKVVIPPFT